jgi:LuxR family transcriptional activator of conjugal transfer of Ti plasmids
MPGTLRAAIDMIDTAYDEKMIKSALKTFAASTGFERFAYLQTEGTEIRTFNSYPPEWQDVYLVNQYSIIDPVVTEAKRRMQIFSWSADNWPARGPSDLRRFRDQAVEHGIRSGITIPVEGSFNTTIMLTFASSNSSADPSALGNSVKVIQMVLAIHYRLKFLARGTILAPKRMLSPRESVCLTWSTKGKFMHEIADLTGINPRTVQHYMDSARLKLEARTLQQLVAIAKDRGLV